MRNAADDRKGGALRHSGRRGNFHWRDAVDVVPGLALTTPVHFCCRSRIRTAWIEITMPSTTF